MSERGATDARARAAIARSKPWPKGHGFEDFTPGQIWHHHWGRTLTEADSLLFTTMTLSYNPLYLNRAYARAHGHPDLVVNPLLVLNTVLGLSVEDLSEAGGPLLAVDAVTYHAPVYPGDTLLARSTTRACRRSERHPEHGVVSWHTEGVRASGELVIDFQRTNLVRVRARGAELAAAPGGPP